MNILPILFLASAPLGLFHDIGTAPQTECRTWQDCRDQALAAAERQEYESFHDLAWRAVRLGPPEDPVLLSILARAQSRSGRPHDALVMLQRLAAKGVVTDAATSDDFRRVRGLAGWPELEARLTELIAAGTAKLIPGEIAADPAVAATATPPTTPGSRGITGGQARKEEAAVRAAAPEAPLAGDAADAVRFTTFPFTPAGLAYDGVSSRFVVGDRLARRLTVVGEQSQRLANLASAQSAGFGDITAFEIDPRQGDLWVVSTAADADGPSSSLHKLQLTSGRVLYSIGSATEQGPARFVDVAVTPQGTVLVLDGEGGRLFRMKTQSRELQHATHLKVRAAASIAPASETVAYVAHEAGVVRIDHGAGTVVAVSGADRLDLSGLTWLRWHRRALVGIQAAGASYRVVRMALDRQGTRVTGIAVLDRNVAMQDPTAATLWRDALFYLTDTPGTRDDGTVDIAVRRIHLK